MPLLFFALIPPKTGGENQVIDSRKIEKIIQSERPDLHQTLKEKFPHKRHIVDQGNQLPYVMQPIFSNPEAILHVLIFACSLTVLIKIKPALP